MVQLTPAGSVPEATSMDATDRLLGSVGGVTRRVTPDALKKQMREVDAYDDLDALTSDDVPAGAYIKVLDGGAILQGVTSGVEIVTTGGAQLAVVRGPEFNTRTDVTLGEIAKYPDGTIGYAAGMAYEADSSATGAGSVGVDEAVDGVVLYGEAYLGHFGSLSQAGTWCAANGKTLNIISDVSVDADTTVASSVHIKGATLTPASGVTLTISGEVIAGYEQVFDLTDGSLSLGYAQDVLPEWFGSGNTAIRDALKKSAAGSRVRLRGVAYESVAITWTNDPLAADGEDTGKIIEGVTPAQRYKTTGEFFGSRIVLADGQDANLFTIDSAGANSWGNGAIRNVMLDGNGSNNSAGCGVEFLDVKDFELHNVYAWAFADDGLKFSGSNNQINLSGFIELWNNGGRGLNGQAVGDPQWTATIRCVNNTGYDCYISEGNGYISQIYCYFGGGFRHDGAKPLRIDYLRCEDCDGAGAEFRGFLDIGVAVLSDNGVNGSSGTNLCGGYMQNANAHVTIGTLLSANRVAATHKQRHLIYSLAGQLHIGTLRDDAFGQHGVASEQTLLITNNTSLAASVSVGSRPILSDTYANVKNAGASITPLPSTYGGYQVSALTESMGVNNTTANASCEGMELSFQITSSGTYNVSWGSEYLAQDGTALSASALTSGQTVRARFRQQGGKWLAIMPVTVS